MARTRTSAGLRMVGCGLLGLLAGCARQATVAGIEPLPVVEEAAAAPDTLPADVTEDSAADRRALEALAELEFGSLDRRSEHVRGQLMTHLRVSPSDVADESGRLFNGGHGGAASVAAPTFDINVESFANHDRVQYYMDFFLGPARDRFTIWLGRLSRYEGMIRDRLRQQGVPEDLVYLALIESGYSNTAVSRASAVGMWQFVSGTGRRYGLAVDTWVDERRDPFKATDAAARHLAELNEQFGSWYLAAAAYNAGAGRVTRGLKRLPAGNESLSDSTFFELSDGRYLRRETRDYVPKLIAAALIAKEPARYGFDSLTEMAPLEFDEVTITAATGLDVLARLADTTTRALVELNPHFFRGVTPPNRTVIVRVPRGTGPTVARRWTELPPSERVSFLEHRVARGETLSQIAKRYGVSTSLLQAANPGVKPTRLRIGQRLTVPVSAAARRDASRGQPLPRIVPVAAAARPTRYTVRAGDSLWRIAQRYGLRVSDLRAWNGIGEEQVLRVGERLRLAAP